MPQRYNGPRFGGHNGVQFVIVVAASHGSAEIEVLDRLRTVLHQVAGRDETQQVRVDLSETPMYGARFWDCWWNWPTSLRSKTLD